MYYDPRTNTYSKTPFPQDPNMGQYPNQYQQRPPSHGLDLTGVKFTDNNTNTERKF